VIAQNVPKIKERIKTACAKVGRDPSTVTIIAISKGRSIEQIQEVIAAGIIDIGENKVQEALLKYNQLTTHNSQLRTIKWHMVGHLQTNKVKGAVKIFDLIHSVDSLRLAEEISKQAAKINKIQDILMEVKTSPEATKSGLSPEKVIERVKEISQLKNVKIKGLMTLACIVATPEEARPYFRQLRELRDKLITQNSEFRTLSMGMTDDFEVAIEEGATIVRIGRAIFGPSTSLGVAMSERSELNGGG